ncbi:MAG TPA: dihydrofolate reductase family protein [Nocardiopsis listeri]|uniref:dihydrofolate reductase family protein n=1 Tax=Nocardiopsis listeri TaxID=53440 RepID=UPI001D929123|nr:dihydrofolate reductase family protein [Nocardiopsis listeri]HJE57146.1 dihydrofolate reductase family protein [Nocardiopsis listeri]
MRKLTYFVAVSLDGYVCAPDGSFDFFPGGDDDGSSGELGDNGEFHVNEYPELLNTVARAHLGLNVPNKHFDTMLQGRGSYQIALDQGLTSPYGHMREYVYSRTLADGVDPNVTVVATDPLRHVRELKAEDGEPGICTVGGPSIAGLLLPEIDELVIKRYPVVAGAGKSFFEGAAFDPALFERVESNSFENGADYTLFRRRPGAR